MGEIAVFVPGNVPREPATLSRLGLGALLDESVHVGCQDGPNGPDGKQGVLFTFSKTIFPLSARPFTRDSQWHAVAPQGDLQAGRAFIGWNEPPTPDDLARKTMRPGKWLTLESGQPWHIPIARQLPQTLGIDPQTGGVVGRTAERYREFFETAWDSLAWFEPDEEGKCRVDFDPAFAFAVQALAINYRITRDMIGPMGALSSADLFEIARTVIELDDLRDRMAAQKKTTGDAQPTADGEPG